MGRHANADVQLPKVGRLITGPELEFHRRRAGLTTHDLATLTDLPELVIARIESGGGFTVQQNVRLKEVLLAWGERFHMDFDPAATIDELEARPKRRGIGSL